MLFMVPTAGQELNRRAASGLGRIRLRPCCGGRAAQSGLSQKPFPATVVRWEGRALAHLY
jgi:hypothetical protein